MDEYEIIITPDAESNLKEIRDYISITLSAPDTARKYILFLRKELSSLTQMPSRIKLIDDEPWRTYGIRRMIAKNFYIYFRIDADDSKVFILNIVYGKRDQLRFLSDNI